MFVKGELIGGADITEELLESGELEQKLDDALGADRAQDVKVVARVVEAASPSAQGGRGDAVGELARDRVLARGRAHRDGPAEGRLRDELHARPGTSPSSPR